MKENELTNEEIMELMNKPDKFAEALRSLRGEPFSLKDRQYLRNIYREFQSFRPRQVIWLSSRKIEKTETIVNLLLYGVIAIDYFSALYTIARSIQVSDFSNKRMSEAISSSEILDKKLKQPTSVYHKEFTCKSGKRYFNHMYMYSSWGDSASILGHDDDFVVVDEAQDMETAWYPKINEIITGSPHKWLLAAGTARDENDGLHSLFKESTMNEWHVTCPYCKYEQIPGWDNIMGVAGQKYKGCISCKKEIKMNVGRWKPTHDHPEQCYFIGYHTNQIMHPDITADEIYRKYIAYNSERKFHNEVLGLPFSYGFRPITKEMVLGCCRDKEGKPNKINYVMYSKDEGNVLGMDLGKGHHLTVMNKNKRILWQEVIDTTRYKNSQEIIQHIKKIFDRYEISNAVIDYGYSQTETKDLQSIYGEMLKTCRYDKQDIDDWYEYKEEDAEGNKIYRIRVNKARAMEMIITAFTRKEITIPYAQGNSRNMAEATINHYTNLTFDAPIKMDEERKEYKQFRSTEPYTRYARAGPDHFLHSVVYCLLALSELDNEEFIYAEI